MKTEKTARTDGLFHQFDLTAFHFDVIYENNTQDANVTFACNEENALTVCLTAHESLPMFIRMHWPFKCDSDCYVLGDAWERSYGDLQFLPLSKNQRAMPWYFVASNQTESFCFGVKTQPNAFVSFHCDASGISATVDCRNGGCGVHLCGRTVTLCTFLYQSYPLPPFESLCDFCRRLCPQPLLPRDMVYGANNWYYAYGNSSAEEILRDAKLHAGLAKGIKNRPFVVIDDGWQINQCAGPYRPNERFHDMKTLAAALKDCDVQPGIWVRLLLDSDDTLTDDLRILRSGERKFLDPTQPQVQQHIKTVIQTIRDWGYTLLKHDFSTVDLFGDYGKDLTETITNETGWHFADQTKTNAEIVLDLYRLILDACGDMLVLGCNTVSHLCAGLVHINRTGDDTSGKSWERTKTMGVNTLAFRLAQNRAFYLVDADCVGILEQHIPWDKNRQWLDLLSKSNTALFVSCANADSVQATDLRNAYLEAQKQHQIQPLDLYETLTPQQWRIDGTIQQYDWD